MFSFVRKCNGEYRFLKISNGQENKLETEIRLTMDRETERKTEFVYAGAGTVLKYTTVTQK